MSSHILNIDTWPGFLETNLSQNSLTFPSPTNSASFVQFPCWTLFLADDIFVPEVMGFPGFPLTNIRIILKLKLSWVFPKFVSRNGVLEKSQLRYFFESEQKLKYRLKFFSKNPGLVIMLGKLYTTFVNLISWESHWRGIY